ncbi:MAG: hypothetical protein JKY95_13240 [Planctomycetaceae bacterium]|nr:hypothetical protein [Planctomycetaceae bacterium]
MVQCAHFAYDDEELSGCLGGAGGCWPIENEDQDLEDDLLEPDNLADAFCHPDEIDPPEHLANDTWKLSPPQQERESKAAGSLMTNQSQVRPNNVWQRD